MARSLRIEYPGAVYNVTSRGNARAVIYLDGDDRLRFLDVLGGEAFLAGLGARIVKPDTEIPKRRRHLARPSLAALRRAEPPGEQSWMPRAKRDHGYTLAEMAAEMGRHYSTISKIIKVLQAENSKRKTWPHSCAPPCWTKFTPPLTFMAVFQHHRERNRIAKRSLCSSGKHLEHFRIGNAPILKNRAIFPIT